MVFDIFLACRWSELTWDKGRFSVCRQGNSVGLCSVPSLLLERVSGTVAVENSQSGHVRPGSLVVAKRRRAHISRRLAQPIDSANEVSLFPLRLLADPRYPVPTRGMRSFFFLISSRLANTVCISASVVLSKRQLSLLLLIFYPGTRVPLAFSWFSCHFCASRRSAPPSMACCSLCTRMSGSGPSGSVISRSVCNSLATPKLTFNHPCPAKRRFKTASVMAF